MNPESAAAAYREGSIDNAPPVKIVRLLVQGAERFLERALACDPADPASHFVHWLGRADSVVMELRLALDPEASEEISAMLEQLYLFVETKIQEASTSREVDPAREALQIVASLARTWSEVEVPQGTGQEA